MTPCTTTRMTSQTSAPHLCIFKVVQQICHCIDDTRPIFDEAHFKQADWSGYYPGTTDPIPPNMPKPCGLMHGHNHMFCQC